MKLSGIVSLKTKKLHKISTIIIQVQPKSDNMSERYQNVNNVDDLSIKLRPLFILGKFIGLLPHFPNTSTIKSQPPSEQKLSQKNK